MPHEIVTISVIHDHHIRGAVHGIVQHSGEKYIIYICHGQGLENTLYTNLENCAISLRMALDNILSQFLESFSLIAHRLFVYGRYSRCNVFTRH